MEQTGGRSRRMDGWMSAVTSSETQCSAMDLLSSSHTKFSEMYFRQNNLGWLLGIQGPWTLLPLSPNYKN